jgi:hypothetical protein
MTDAPKSQEQKVRELREKYKKSKLPERKKIFLVVLEEALGNISQACKIVDIERQTYYQWYHKDEKFKKKIDDLQEVAKDFVESKLMGNIRDGKETSIIFYLKSKAKDRGYIEQSLNINTNIERNDLAEKSNEELLAILNR